MLNSTTLEVAIGMALVYLLLSLFCTAINERVLLASRLRAKNLETPQRVLQRVQLNELLTRSQNCYERQASEGSGFAV
jgi:hypothetical protein